MEKLFITCPKFLEDLLYEELQSLGVEELFIVGHGVFAQKSLHNVYLINYASRFANRVLWPLKEFRVYDKEDLYALAKEIEWDLYLSPQKTFSIDSDVFGHPNFTNSHFAALVVKDAICDYFKEKCGERPSVEKQHPDVHINLHIYKDKATIYFDTSNDPLYKRGYREGGHLAPLQENLAAAMVAITKPTTKDIIADPFCGSGTFLVETLMHLAHIPGGKLRTKWGMELLPGFDPHEFEAVKKLCDEKISVPTKLFLIGNDKDNASVQTAGRQLGKFSSSCFYLQEKPVRYAIPPLKPTLVITNPPYGIRLVKDAHLLSDLKMYLQTKCAPTVRVFILYENILELKKAGFKVLKTWSFTSGGLKVKLCQISS